jgi:competence protein ComEA
MPIRKIIRDYLSFGKRDRIGIIVLLLLVMAIYFLPLFFEKKNEPFPIKRGSLLDQAIDSLEKETHQNEEGISAKTNANAGKSDYTSGELFRFDPNTVIEKDWQRLGLPEKTIRTISNYRNKGGKFYKPEDLKKIWGLPEGFYERVKDHIFIPTPEDQVKNNDKIPFEKKENKLVVLDINEADSAGFTVLPGIGSRLASRIIHFREKLGGFYTIDQVAETFGLSDSVFQKLKPLLELTDAVQKININTANLDTLKTHPYIRWKMAKAIIAYREQHGNFKSLEELKNIPLIDPQSFDKIIHYLTL